MFYFGRLRAYACELKAQYLMNIHKANENYSNVQRKRKNINLTIEKIEQALPLLQNYIKLKACFVILLGNNQIGMRRLFYKLS